MTAATIALSCVAALAAPAFAQNAQQACAGDIATYCAGIPQGGGKIALVSDPQGAPFGLLEWPTAESEGRDQ